MEIVNYRQRFMKFIWLLILMAIIPLGGAGYFVWQFNEVQITQNRAAIAQAQPSIIMAEGQRAISRALATTIIIDKFLMGALIVCIVIILLSIIALLAYTLFQREGNNEKRLQQHYTDYATLPDKT